MTVSFSDLSRAEVLMLERLDDEWDHADSVGQPMRSLPDSMLATAFGLIDLGVATVTFGWKGAGWVRLSEAGRQVKDEGSVG